MLALVARRDEGGAGRTSASLGREPTDCELETIAQTWSEHCSHKTLKGTITLDDKTTGQTRTYKNLLKETVFAATQTIRAEARDG